MIRLIPREEKFFELFSKASKNLLAATDEFKKLLNDYQNVQEKVKRIGGFEHEGDIIIHEIMDKLNRTFVTPIEREDIHALASGIDDVLDLIHETADIMHLYGLKSPTPQVLKQTDILFDAVEQLDKAVNSLQDLKNTRRLLDYCIEINRLENEGDDLLRTTLAELFYKTTQPLDLMRLKEVYEHIEQALDKCEDLAVIIEGIVVKHA